MPIDINDIEYIEYFVPDACPYCGKQVEEDGYACGYCEKWPYTRWYH